MLRVEGQTLKGVQGNKLLVSFLQRRKEKRDRGEWKKGEIRPAESTVDPQRRKE